MKRKINNALLIGLSIALFSGCSLIDPTEIKNPNLTEENILGAGISKTAPWVRGMERQLALTFNEIVTPNEIASDNYQNTNTYFNQLFDVPTFDNTDPDVNPMLLHISRLKEYSLYGLRTIVPSDESTTANELAELHFYVGLSHLLLGELFVTAPADPDGAPVTSAEQFTRAIAHLDTAITITEHPENKVGYKILIARAYRSAGDKTNAVRFAQEAIDEAADNYLRLVRYDRVNGPTNEMQDAVYDRGNFDDLQPLPRLDFLDPKYYTVSATQESHVPLIKLEEAYFILAEADLSDNSLANGLAKLRSLIEVVDARPKAMFIDQTEGRTQDEPGSRPNKASVKVAASATDPLLEGLVLERGAPTVTVPTVSGISIAAADVTGSNYGSIDEALELLYLLRQQVFFGEGRRSVDLGLKYPVSFNEIVSNPNINPGDPATVGQIPPFIPTGREMDAFTYNVAEGTCVIRHNMNRVLVENKTSPFILPFFN